MAQTRKFIRWCKHRTFWRAVDLDLLNPDKGLYWKDFGYCGQCGSYVELHNDPTIDWIKENIPEEHWEGIIDYLQLGPSEIKSSFDFYNA